MAEAIGISAMNSSTDQFTHFYAWFTFTTNLTRHHISMVYFYTNSLQGLQFTRHFAFAFHSVCTTIPCPSFTKIYRTIRKYDALQMLQICTQSYVWF